MYPLQNVGKYTVSKNEFLQVPRIVNSVRLVIPQDTQISLPLGRS